jgi:hypothetical protein
MEKSWGRMDLDSYSFIIHGTRVPQLPPRSSDPIIEAAHPAGASIATESDSGDSLVDVVARSNENLEPFLVIGKIKYPYAVASLVRCW